MRIFVDTSAFLAVLNAGDAEHKRAAEIWRRELVADTRLLTTSYVLVETTALLQHRIGLEAVRVFEREMLPMIEVEWVGETQHRAAFSALIAADRRRLSLVDCVSFEVMRALGMRSCFSFDPHFAEQGFELL